MAKETMQTRSDNYPGIYYLLRGVSATLLLGGLLLLSACHGRGGSARPAADDPVRKYLGVAVELGERDPDSLDFYVGADPELEKLRANPEALDGIHNSARALSIEVRDIPASAAFDAVRKSGLLAQIDAIALRTEELRGNFRPFDEESRILFGVVAPADDDAASRAKVRAHVAHLLADEKDPAAAYERLDAQFVVRPDRVPAVMAAALQQCRALTLQHMALPPGEHVDVKYVYLKPWSAFSHYMGNAHSVIEVNMDYPLTVDRIMNLACHEGYPGHHVFNTMRDFSLVRGRRLDEFRVQTTFSPQSYVSEAAASYAPSLVLSDAERLHIERDLLLPIAGLKGLDCQRYLEVERLIDSLHTAEPSIARDFLDGKLEFVRAADALERETLMQHGETMLLYLNEYRSYMLSYTLGVDTVKALIEAGHPTDAERWQRYQNLMTNPVVFLPSPGK
jgi:hypothetical protein